MARNGSVTRGGGLFRHNVILLFAAGFISVLVFQAGANAILHAYGFANQPFNYTRTRPFGVPAVWSGAFFGGLWALVFGLVEKHFPRAPLYYVCAFLFGAIAPVLVLWFIVSPLKGNPIAAGWNTQRMAIQMLVHGCFGLGVGILVRAFAGRDARA